MSAPARRPTRERELAPAVASFLAARGYEVWIDPDGSDYFDVVALRGTTVGLVELKIADGRTVLRQALRRRAWGDWVAVAVPSEGLARRIGERPVAPRGRRIGIWWVDALGVHELRPAVPLVADGEPDPFAATRRELAERLALLRAGALAVGVAWNLAGSARRTAPGGRSSRDWRLEEFPSASGDRP